MTKPWQTAKWFVSPFNFDKEATAGISPPKKLRIHDVTLRDGEQQAGVIFSKCDKVVIGRSL